MHGQKNIKYSSIISKIYSYKKLDLPPTKPHYTIYVTKKQLYCYSCYF